MMTRLKVNGFKNLVDVDVRFGPFTCIAGANAAGKSNLFDAIRFLSLLAEKPLVEAALEVIRGSGGRSPDIRGLFHRVGDQYVDEMSFEAEMIIPAEGVDDLGQEIKSESTFLDYELKIAYRGDDPHFPSIPLWILSEKLDSSSSDDAGQAIRFPVGREWADATLRGNGQTQANILHTKSEPARRLKWVLSVDGEMAAERVGAPVFRTYLGFPGASQSPTINLARQEMRSWRVFNLDPAVMREPDDFTASTEIGSDGAHVAAALYSVAHAPSPDVRDPLETESAVYAGVANRLYHLVDDVRDIAVERDDKREELSLLVTGRDGTQHSARALSDGTLRFLALAVLEAQEQPGVVCIEEPENGIHPGRIPALLDLLQAIAMDTAYPIEPGNPLRQVIISTHSPSIVARVPGDSIVVAELRSTVNDGKHFKRAHFGGLSGTWRVSEGQGGVALATLLAYLNPEGYRPLPEPVDQTGPEARRRILDRADVRDLLSPTPVDG